jgi:CcmD family protein
MDARNFQYMFYGFAVAWIIPMLYVILLGARERRLRAELERVKKMIEQGGKEYGNEAPRSVQI